MEGLKIIIFVLCVENLISAPISVPIENNYQVNPSYSSQQEYFDDISARRPNSDFNRLPSNQVDDVSNAASTNDDDYEEQTDKPVLYSGNQQSSNFLNNNFLLNENRRKRRRRIRRPCIPVQSAGSSLFSNSLKRDNYRESEAFKTFNLFGYAPLAYYDPVIFGDNVKPQNDHQGSGQVQYSPNGGYPCIPVSFGTQQGLFGNRPQQGLFVNRPQQGLFGGGAGPLGFFGQGGLLDFAGPSPLVTPGVYQGAGNYPQTVIINRPPLFGNLPSFNRPQNTQSATYNPTNGIYSSPNDNQNRPGFWGNVVNKLSEFVSSINPQQVYGTIGDTLQGIATAINSNQPVNTVREGYREFSSLLF